MPSYLTTYRSTNHHQMLQTSSVTRTATMLTLAVASGLNLQLPQPWIAWNRRIHRACQTCMKVATTNILWLRYPKNQHSMARSQMLITIITWITRMRRSTQWLSIGMMPTIKEEADQRQVLLWDLKPLTIKTTIGMKISIDKTACFPLLLQLVPSSGIKDTNKNAM